MEIFFLTFINIYTDIINIIISESLDLCIEDDTTDIILADQKDDLLNEANIVTEKEGNSYSKKYQKTLIQIFLDCN